MQESVVPVSLEDHVDIVSDDDVIAARQKGRMMAAETGFSPTDQAMLAAVITELARNIRDYAGRGEVLFHVIEDAGRRGIAVIARDHGPGIPNIKEALQASYSVAGGLGLGLGGVRTLMDSLDIISAQGKGTTVTARKWRHEVDPRRIRCRQSAGGQRTGAVGALSRRRTLSEIPADRQREYSDALRDYLARPNEQALRRAHEVGRSTLTNGEGVLGITALHHQALKEVIPGLSAQIDEALLIKRAEEVLIESGYLAMQAVREAGRDGPLPVQEDRVAALPEMITASGGLLRCSRWPDSSRQP